MALLAALNGGGNQIHCVEQAIAAAAEVEGPEFRSKPSWALLAQGERPPQPPPELAGEPGIWPHGWQFHASSGQLQKYKERVVWPALDPAAQARLRSQAGAEAGAFLRAIPYDKCTQVRPERFNIFLRRRSRLPLPGGCGRCSACGQQLDPLGDHWASCQWTGRLKRRGTAVERAWRPVFREAPVTVREQPMVRELILGVDEQDARQSDFVVRGTSLGHGLPVVCDCVMGSAIHADGTPWEGAASIDDVANQRGIRRKVLDEYPDLATAPNIVYLILAVEEGGRWSTDVFNLVKDLVRLKAAPEHPLLRRAAQLAWTRRWWSVLSIGVQTAAADCILGCDSPPNAYGSIPTLSSVLPLAEIPPDPSRLV